MPRLSLTFDICLHIAVSVAVASPLGKPLAAVKSFPDSRCGMERISSSNLTPEAFEKLIRGRRTPLVLQNISQISKLQANVGREVIIAAYGDHQVQLASGINENVAFFSVSNRWRKLRDYVEHPTGGPELVFELGQTGNASQSIWGAKIDLLPEFLQYFIGNTIFTLGNEATGTNIHAHEESWVLLLNGRKAWWIGQPDVSENVQYFGLVNPCVHLGTEMPKGFQFCVQQPGELVYFPKGAGHATCNLDDFTWGIGAQGRTSDWPKLVNDATHGDLESVRAAFKPKAASAAKVSRSAFAGALQRAIAFGRRDVVRELLKHAVEMLGAHEGSTVSSSLTTSPLHATVQYGKAPLAEWLVQIGENPYAGYNSMAKGVTPFDMAVMYGHTKIASALTRFLEHPQKVLPHSVYNAATNGHVSMLSQLKSLGGKLNSIGLEGRLPLHGAVAAGQFHVAKKLIGKTAKGVSVQDLQGNTPLHAAAEQGHAVISKYLIGLRADVLTRNHEAQQPLHLAALQGHMLTVDCLLAARSDVNSKGEFSSTPLHFTAHSGSVLAAEVLVMHRARLDVRDRSGWQPLDIAVKRGAKLYVEWLVLSKVDVNILDRGDRTPLALAQQAGHRPLIEYFLHSSSHAHEDL